MQNALIIIKIDSGKDIENLKNQATYMWHNGCETITRTTVSIVMHYTENIIIDAEIRNAIRSV